MLSELPCTEGAGKTAARIARRLELDQPGAFNIERVKAHQRPTGAYQSFVRAADKAWLAEERTVPEECLGNSYYPMNSITVEDDAGCPF
jgi:hypothetical protein